MKEVLFELPIYPADEEIRREYIFYRLWLAGHYGFEEAKIFESFAKVRQQAKAIKQLFEVNYNEWNF